MCSVGAITEIASHLSHFILLFSGDTSANLDQRAALVSHHLISRLTALFVELFSSSSSKPTDTEVLFHCSYAEVEARARNFLDKVGPMGSEFVIVSL